MSGTFDQEKIQRFWYHIIDKYECRTYKEQTREGKQFRILVTRSEKKEIGTLQVYTKSTIQKLGE